jgi:hypothetical protein
MTDFVNQFHRPSMVAIFQSFTNGLAKAYLLYEKESATDEDFKKILAAVASVTLRHSDDIMKVTGADIMRYMSYYEVETREGVDEYKIAYFMGRTYAKFLEKEGHPAAAAVIRFSSVLMLNHLLKKYLPNGRPELVERLTRVIRERQVEERLGADGIYLLFRCASRMLRDAERAREALMLLHQQSQL